ncbi:SDR family NAD(P)-dependent oxidoreductase [Streptacidiphilus sp. PAMC 29251]
MPPKPRPTPTPPRGLPAPPLPGASALPPGTFQGTAVFVTGGGTGLGKAVAVEFARLGAAVVIASRKPEHLAAGRRELEQLGAPVHTVVCDIRDPESVAAAFDQAEAAFGLPAVLVNNAAANFPVPAEDMSPTPGAPSSTSPSTAPSTAPVSSGGDTWRPAPRPP